MEVANTTSLQRFIKNKEYTHKQQVKDLSKEKINSSRSYPIHKKRNKLPERIKSKRTKSDGAVFAIAGVHGVGKTTVYNLLQREFEEIHQIKLFPERLELNPPFPFGSKDKQIAFRSELHYIQQMIARNELIKKFIKNRREHIAILDRSPLSVLIYSRALGLPKKDYGLIESTFKSVPWLKEIIIYLEAEPKTILNRIYKRGSLDPERKKWNEEDHEYLKRVLRFYEEIFREYKLESKQTLIRINTENMKPEDVVKRILEIIEEKTGVQILKIPKVPDSQTKITKFIIN